MKVTAKITGEKDNKVTADVTLSKADVDKAVRQTYQDISNKYNFQGFRKGHTPRPVIDSTYGKEAVLANATNTLLQEAEPLLFSELDQVVIAAPDYSKVENSVVEGKDYSYTVTLEVEPKGSLSSYGAVSIEMPPEEVTDSEVENQIELLLAYQTRPENVKEGTAAKAKNYVEILYQDPAHKDAPEQKRVFKLDNKNNPKGLNEALIGKKVGQTAEIIVDQDSSDKVKAKVEQIYDFVTPKLDDKLAKEAFGFDDVAALKEAVKKEIEQKKQQEFPTLKHNRSVEALCERLEQKELSKEYREFVFRNIAQNFMSDLAKQGQNVDSFLAMRNITMDQLLEDLHAQADTFAKQAVALDAFAEHKKIEVTEDDVADEFNKAGIANKDIKAQMKAAEQDGRMPQIKSSIRRNKAANVLVEEAKVKVVDATKKRKDA